ERMRQVRRPDEQHVRTGKGGDRVGIRDGRGVLDLEDAEDDVVEAADVAMADPTEALSADAERDPALAFGREPHPRKGLGDIRGAVDPRDDEAAGPEVEGSRDSEAVAALDAHESGRRG